MELTARWPPCAQVGRSPSHTCWLCRDTAMLQVGVDEQVEHPDCETEVRGSSGCSHLPLEASSRRPASKRSRLYSTGPDRNIGLNVSGHPPLGSSCGAKLSTLMQEL